MIFLTVITYLLYVQGRYHKYTVTDYIDLTKLGFKEIPEDFEINEIEFHYLADNIEASQFPKITSQERKGNIVEIKFELNQDIMSIVGRSFCVNYIFEEPSRTMIFNYFVSNDKKCGPLSFKKNIVPDFFTELADIFLYKMIHKSDPKTYDKSKKDLGNSPFFKWVSEDKKQKLDIDSLETSNVPEDIKKFTFCGVELDYVEKKYENPETLRKDMYEKMKGENFDEREFLVKILRDYHTFIEKDQNTNMIFFPESSTVLTITDMFIYDLELETERCELVFSKDAKERKFDVKIIKQWKKRTAKLIPKYYDFDISTYQVQLKEFAKNETELKSQDVKNDVEYLNKRSVGIMFVPKTSD